MKRCLTIALILATMSFNFTTSVSAASIGSQSVDVVVGEVDKIDSSDEVIGEDSEQEVSDVPNTGLFGAGVDEASAIVATSSAVVVAIILVWLFVYFRRKFTK